MEKDKSIQIAIFDTRKYDKEGFLIANKDYGYNLLFFEPRLTEATAHLVPPDSIVCSFVNDRLNEVTLEALAKRGVKLIVLRSAGFNHVDIKAAGRFQIKIARVPEYSPYAVAEHAVALLMTLNRKTHRSFNRVREMNFSLEGLVGFDLHGKTVGIVGLGRIGIAFARIMKGFGCRILAFDLQTNTHLQSELGLSYVTFEELLKECDIISLHVPLNSGTRHLFSEHAFSQVKRSLILINTGRGALIDSKSLIEALKNHRIGGACLDVYEEEEGIFFSDYSDSGIDDDLLARLITFPNVIISSHQGFLTQEALANIAETTLENVSAFSKGTKLAHEVVMP